MPSEKSVATMRRPGDLDGYGSRFLLRRGHPAFGASTEHRRAHAHANRYSCDVDPRRPRPRYATHTEAGDLRDQRRGHRWRVLSHPGCGYPDRQRVGLFQGSRNQRVRPRGDFGPLPTSVSVTLVSSVSSHGEPPARHLASPSRRWQKELPSVNSLPGSSSSRSCEPQAVAAVHDHRSGRSRSPERAVRPLPSRLARASAGLSICTGYSWVPMSLRRLCM